MPNVVVGIIGEFLGATTRGDLREHLNLVEKRYETAIAGVELAAKCVTQSRRFARAAAGG